jgi:ribosome maturation factor RimP
VLFSATKDHVSAASPRFFVTWGSKLTPVEAFERIALALPFEEGFQDIEIVAHRTRREGRAAALTLIVDRPGGVDLALCERLAGRINAALAETEEPYTLAVESPGLDRPLVKPEDYTRFAGRPVCIRTTIAIRGAKTHRGKLVMLRESNLILETTEGELPLPLSTIKSANLEFDPRADLRDEKKRRKTEL